MPPTGQYDLYSVTLSYRAETLTDVENVHQRFKESGNDKDGYIRTLHYSQVGTLPDFNVNQLELAVWVTRDHDALEALNKVVKRFLKAIKESPDCHVIKETINYHGLYMGERSYDSDGWLEEDDDGIIYGLKKEMQLVDDELYLY